MISPKIAPNISVSSFSLPDDASIAKKEKGVVVCHTTKSTPQITHP
jgi:hypothetical protein